jgi:DNA-binding NtrC family response regulator/tetratricopeptide (TPR) repeat protein
MPDQSLEKTSESPTRLQPPLAPGQKWPPGRMPPLVGQAPAIAALREQIERLAAFDRPGSPHVPTVLLQGETGTGKGLVAKLIHESGARSGGPFVDVNCAAIPDTMLEAELFGFEAGAFTDARRAKPGLFETASGGTLFLDEVDALPLALQGKLLKAIEEKRIRRLGAVVSLAVDVKLVAATQYDLRERVADRTFRADLFHRLAVVVLDMPPLRARGDDVVDLAEHFLAEHARAHGLESRRLTSAARAWLGAHPWPGNVRELSHLMERATLLCGEIDVSREALERLQMPLGRAVSPPISPATDDEASRIRDALLRAGGNVVRAARLLGVGRNALRGRMRRLGLERPTLADLKEAPRPTPPGEAPPPAGDEVAEPASEPSWEQKAVAVLAIDLVLPERAPEPWTVARRWQRILEERVAGFGGVFLARTPARMTAVFGLPRALEQLPQRAAQAALAIQRLAAEELAERRPELRIGLHAGAVHVDTRAADPVATLLALGDTVALPERLLGHAGPGEILVSAAFARRIAAVCDLRPRALRVGDGETMQASVVLGQRARVEPPGESRFVGRERELGLLREALDCTTAGEGQVVLVVGDPGIGKSRLLAEFRGGITGDHLWIEGRCASYATTTPFHPVIDGLRRFVGIDDRDDAASASAKVERGILWFGDDLGWTLPFVRHLLAFDPGDAAVSAMDSGSRRSETFRALKAITLRAAERRPLVVVVEDLHWMDSASEEYLAFLADAVPATRVLLVCSYRPGYRHGFGDRTYQVRLSLRALSAEEIADITGSLLGTADVPEALRGLIAEKAEGNPFFVEEVTRSLLEDGSLRREDGRVVLARELADISVPDTIQDVLIARIDRLADEARRAIQVASVIGREFALRLLERITEGGQGVRLQIDELRALELIYEKTAHPELAFMFKHALTHDVAYESVLRERRRQLHRTIGLAIEELYADRLAELYETLAHHFERGEDWERALAYHDRAAAKAAERFANRAVIAHCRAALAIADRPDVRVSGEQRRGLEERLGFASFFASEFQASGDAFRRAAEPGAEDRPRAVRLAYAGLSYFWSHDYRASEETLEAALAIARRAGLPGAEARALNIRAWHVGILRGDMPEWIRLLEESERLAHTAADEEAVALARFNLAQAAEWMGDYPRAIALSEAVLATGRRLRLPHLVAWPKWFIGKAACCLGDYGRAVAELVEGCELCERIGDRAWTSRLLNTLGWCYAEVGSIARAREYNERAAALARAIGDPEIVANSEINLIGNWLALGNGDRALAYLEPIRDALGRPGDPWMRWRYTLHATDAAGRVAFAQRRLEDALTAADEELAGARRHRVTKVEARALLLRGDVLLALDRRTDAELALTEATEIAERIRHPRTVWTALRSLAELRRRAGRTGDAEALLARRRALVERAALAIDDHQLRGDLVAATRVDQ